MADLPPYRTPRWVKMFGIIAIGLVLLVVVMLLVTSALGLHAPSGGPARHIPSSDAGSQTPLSGYDLAGQTARSIIPERVIQIS